MRRRGCLFGCSGAVLIAIVMCALLWFVGLPRFQDSLRDGLSDELSTQVASQISAQVPGAKLQPGEYRISLSDLQQQMNASNDNGQISGFDIRSAGDEIVLTIQSSGQKLEYRGVPTIVDGRLEMTQMTSSGGALDYVMPPDKLGQAIDSGINSYIQGQGLNLEDVRVEGSDLVFDVVP